MSQNSQKMTATNIFQAKNSPESPFNTTININTNTNADTDTKWWQNTYIRNTLQLVLSQCFVLHLTRTRNSNCEIAQYNRNTSDWWVPIARNSSPVLISVFDVALVACDHRIGRPSHPFPSPYLVVLLWQLWNSYRVLNSRSMRIMTENNTQYHWGCGNVTLDLYLSVTYQAFAIWLPEKSISRSSLIPGRKGPLLSHCIQRTISEVSIQTIRGKIILIPEKSTPLKLNLIKLNNPLSWIFPRPWFHPSIFQWNYSQSNCEVEFLSKLRKTPVIWKPFKLKTLNSTASNMQILQQQANIAGLVILSRKLCVMWSLNKVQLVASSVDYFVVYESQTMPSSSNCVRRKKFTSCKLNSV